MNALDAFRQTFGGPRALIGMIYVGVQRYAMAGQIGLKKLVDDAVAEASVYREAGFTGLLMEYSHESFTCTREIGPETVAVMTRVGREIKRSVLLPLGVQVPVGANAEGIAVAHASGAEFVRCESFASSRANDERSTGLERHELVLYRGGIGAQRVQIYMDVKKTNFTHALAGGVGLTEAAREAERFGANGVVVTGTPASGPALPADVEAVAGAIQGPVIVSSSLAPANLASYAAAHGFVVGLAVKRDGLWSNPLDRAAMQAVASAFAALAPAGPSRADPLRSTR